YRVPGGVAGQLGAKYLRGRPAGFARDAVTVADQTADFQLGKSIEVRANVGHVPLNFRMERRRVFHWLDHLRDRSEDEAGRAAERFRLQLPDPVHEDVGGAQGGPDHSAAAAISS